MNNHHRVACQSDASGRTFLHRFPKACNSHQGSQKNRGQVPAMAVCCLNIKKITHLCPCTSLEGCNNETESNTCINYAAAHSNSLITSQQKASHTVRRPNTSIFEKHESEINMLALSFSLVNRHGSQRQRVLKKPRANASLVPDRVNHNNWEILCIGQFSPVTTTTTATTTTTTIQFIIFYCCHASKRAFSCNSKE